MRCQHKSCNRIAAMNILCLIGINTGSCVIFPVPSVCLTFLKFMRYYYQIRRKDVNRPLNNRIARINCLKRIAINTRFGNWLAVEIFFVARANNLAQFRYRRFFSGKMQRIFFGYAIFNNRPSVIACVVTSYAAPLKYISQTNNSRRINLFNTMLIQYYASNGITAILIGLKECMFAKPR